MKDAIEKKTCKRLRISELKRRKNLAVPTPFTHAEYAQLFELHRALGCHWRVIAQSFQHRSDNEVKNAFFACVRKGARRLARLAVGQGHGRDVQKLKPRTLAAFTLETIDFSLGPSLPPESPGWLRQKQIDVGQLMLALTYPKEGDTIPADARPLLKLAFSHLLQLDSRCGEMGNAQESKQELISEESVTSKARELRSAFDGLRLPSAAQKLSSTQLAALLTRISNLSSQISSFLVSDTDGTGLLDQIVGCFQDRTPDLPPGVVSLNSHISRGSWTPTAIYGPGSANLFADDVDPAISHPQDSFIASLLTEQGYRSSEAGLRISHLSRSKD